MAGSAWTNQVQFLVIVGGSSGAGVFVYSGTPGLGNPPIFWATSGTADPFGNAVPSTVGVAGTGTFRAGNTIITPSGQFTYSGTPAANNLLMSLAPANGTDSFGNHYVAGQWVYGATTGLGFASGSQVLGVITGSLAAGWAISTILSSDGTNTFIDGNVAIQTGPLTSTQGTASAPTLITTDTWHNMSLLNGWSLGASGYAQYKLEPNNRVSVRGANIIPGTITGGTNVWTIPAGPPSYVPSVTARVVMDVEVSTGTPVTDTPRFDATTGGQFQCFNVPASTTRVGFNDSFALD